MSIQGSINQAIGTVSVAKKMFMSKASPFGGMSGMANSSMAASPSHDAVKMQQANANAQTNAKTQKQQKDESYYKKMIQGYSTTLGPLKSLDPKIQEQIVRQDTNLQKLLKDSMESK